MDKQLISMLVCPLCKGKLKFDREASLFGKQNDIFEAVNKLNNRPRKKLGYKTPKEVFYQFINLNSKLALGT